ncbi:MAG: hypothetical protein AAB855_03170 [Patescibacteria group bacterium]
MTEAAYEKMIAELSHEMDEKLQELNRGDVEPLDEFIDRALTLRAALQDIRGSARGDIPNSVFSLGMVRASIDAFQEYRRGRSKHIGLSQKEVAQIKDINIQQISQLLNDHPPYDTISYLPMIKTTFGTTTAERNYSKSLQQDLERANANDQVMVFVWGERLRIHAQELLNDGLRALLTKDVDPTIDGSSEAFWNLVLLGTDIKTQGSVREGVEFLRGFVERMTFLSDKNARAIYGNETQRALTVWRAILSMRESIPTTALKSFRQASISNIMEHQFDDAEQKLTDTIRIYSLSMPEHIRVGVSTLNTSKESKKKKSAFRIMTERRFAEQLAKIKPFIGQIFIKKGGARVKILRAEPDIRIGYHGVMRPGVEVMELGTVRHPIHEPPKKPKVYLPVDIIRKMENEQWRPET